MKKKIIDWMYQLIDLEGFEREGKGDKDIYKRKGAFKIGKFDDDKMYKKGWTPVDPNTLTELEWANLKEFWLINTGQKKEIKENIIITQNEMF